MKFSCEKYLLQTAISTAARAVSPKSSIPALEGILLEAADELRLTGYNLETGIRTTVPAQIEKKGSLVLSARLFGDIVRKLPDDMVVVSAENLMVNIKCGLSEFNIMATASEDFPELPTVEYQQSFSIAERDLGDMLGQTLFAVSDNESRPIHTGALLEVDDTGLTVVAVDGFRLALRREPIEQKDSGSFSFVVPGAALGEVEKICGDSEELITVFHGARHVMFKTGSTILVSRRLEGEFLAWRQAIPRNNSITVEGETQTLLSSIERVSLIISDKLKSPLRCVFDDGVLRISTKTAIGDAADRCPIDGDGGGIVNIASVNSFLPLTKIPAYSAAKEAVANLTKWLATYFSGVGIRVNAIAPGFLSTRQTRSLFYQADGTTPTPRLRKIVEGTPMKRLGEPSELGGILLFLLSEEASSFVTGAVIPVDGGFTAYSGV